MPSKQLVIITDDLTSATDCGINVARSGFRTLVLLGEYRDVPGTDVISINTDTRGIPKEEAYRIVKEAALRIKTGKYGIVYKSIDSTLRGNFAVETDAVMDVFDFDFAVVVPAFPFYGRTTIGGRHFLNGIRLTYTEFAHDPRSPVEEDDIVKLFSSQSRRKVGLVELDVLRRGFSAVSEAMDSFARQRIEVVIFDTQVEEDLDKVVETVSRTGYRVLWVGSTGLSRYISKLLSVSRKEIVQIRHVPGAHGILVISGSLSEVTREQIASLRSLTEIVSVEMNPLEILGNDRNRNAEIDRCSLQLTRALNSGNDAVLYLSSSRDKVTASKSKVSKIGLEVSQGSIRILDALAKVTKEVVHKCTLGGLILTGGDTAKVICSQLGAVAIELIDEVEPGIPLGRLVGRMLFVVTKAGGFGTRDSLINSLKALRRITC